MQKERYFLENEPARIKIHAEWNINDASYFVKKLYEYVEESKISFELNAKKGSIINEFFITIFGGIASALIYDLIKTIFNLLKKERIKGNQVKPVYIFTLKEEYIITGDKDSKIPEELKEELFK